MTEIKRRRKWRADIIETENWLNYMHFNGYALKDVNFKTGKFFFESAPSEMFYYRIGYEKNCSSTPDVYLAENCFESICCSNNHFVMRTKNQNPPLSPPYDAYLDKSVKKKFVIGMTLLAYLMLFIFNALLFVFALVASLTGQLEFGGFIAISVVTLIFSVPIWLLTLHFKKLAKINKKLEAVCGSPLNLDWTIPQDTILSRDTIAKLKKEKRYVKKIRLAWFYSPDKTEQWLEKMESKGFNLVRMSKLGNTFHFVKSDPRKVKYHIDYQNKTDPTYYNLHKDNGWKLFFTSLTRIQSFTVWGKEYTDEVPAFYSNKQSLLKHARRFALTFALLFLPLSLAYLALLILYIGQGLMFLPLIILYPIIVIEFGYFAILTICYYFRVKKSTKLDNNEDCLVNS